MFAKFENNLAIRLGVLLTILFSSSELQADQLNWRDDEINCDWSIECAFNDPPLHEIRSPADQCSTLCRILKPCTHFSWIDKAGGICKLHNNCNVNKPDAKLIGKGAVCGIMKKQV